MQRAGGVEPEHLYCPATKIGVPGGPTERQHGVVCAPSFEPVPDAVLVLEGGGMNGIGLGGAVGALMRAGYTFPRVAGTSAGAIAPPAGRGDRRGRADTGDGPAATRVPGRGPRVPVLSEAIGRAFSRDGASPAE